MKINGMRALKLTTCFMLGVIGFDVASASQPSNEELSQVAQSKKWQSLLHYRPQGILGQVYSEVDDERFFYAPNGATSALDELEATLVAMQKQQADDEAASCRFPARYNFLNHTFPNLNLVAGSCPAYSDWKSKVQGHSLSLIFPASYINSPSSMFGHTLLRLDGKQGHDLLSSAINFAAYTDPNDDEITFTVKGLTGGYPGYVSLMPYYEKVNEYNHIESRDIWEYKLMLSQDQIDEFIRHIWELNEIRFDYFFIDENCSYRLLTILEAVNPDWSLSEPFDYRTVPTDTIRSLTRAGLIGEVSFRPSKTTHIEHQRQQLSGPLRQLARDLADNPDKVAQENRFLQLAEQEKAQVLELAYQYNRYLDVKKKVNDPTLHARSLKLLSLRSKVMFKGIPFDDTPTPSVRDEEGHNTFRSLIAFGNTADHSYGEFGMRINYHDWLDSINGYREGSEIEMGDIRLRAYDNDVQLQRFDVLSIRSLGPRNRLSHPISWQVSGGYERWSVDGSSHNHLTLGGGATVKAGNALLYGMGNLQLAYGARYQHNWRGAVGPEVGALIQQPVFSLWTSARYWTSLDDNKDSAEFQVSGAYVLSTHHQLRLEWTTHEWGSDSEQDWRLSYVVYH